MSTSPPYETDPRTSEELVETCRAAWARKDYACDAFAPLHHRGDDRAVEPLMALAGHPCGEVRYAVASSLPSAAFDSPKEPLAAAAMVPLCADSDFDTRNWAVFGLGQMRDQDSPEIHTALAAALADPDEEISGEALVGLAIRKAPGIRELICERLGGESLHCLTLEAAEELGDASLLPHLEALLPAFEHEPEGGLKQCLHSAIQRLRHGADRPRL